jgi:hypothetical protein
MVTLAEGLIDHGKVPVVITLALATKLNYCTTNHHVGQGGWASYVLKVVRALVHELANDAFKRELHTFCHWFGTHGSLRLFNILTPVLLNPLYANPKTPIMSDDFVTRNDTFPAGTARVTIVDAAVRKTKSSPLWAACPGLPLIGESVDWVADIKAQVVQFRNAAAAAGAMAADVPRTNNNPLTPAEIFTRDPTNYDPRVPFHIGADFLAGRACVRATPTLNDATELIGPIFFYMKKKSTITASPHITRMEGGTARPA